MDILKRKIRVNDEVSVSSQWMVPAEYQKGKSSAVIIAHGAGNDMHSEFISFVHKALAEKGLLAVKFNFPYKEAGRRAPDRAPLLEAAWRSVVNSVRQDASLAPNKLYFSGKSMGGRMASHIVASGEACDGLIFLGYPLHPPNKTDKLRSEHLKNITYPMLFIQGTRDSLCNLELLDDVVKNLKAPVTQHIITGGDHSFKVLKKLNRTEKEVWDEIVDTVFNWIVEYRMEH